MVRNIFVTKLLVDHVEQKFVAKAKITWGDIDIASKTINSKSEQLIMIPRLQEEQRDFLVFEKYDIKDDLIHNIFPRKLRPGPNNTFESIKKHHIIRKYDYYEIIKNK